VLKVEDAEANEGDWDEVLRNPRINRECVRGAGNLPPNRSGVRLGRLPQSHLEYIISQMVTKNLAVYEPVKQTRSVLLYWRLPEEWAEVLYEWVCPGHGTMEFDI
jgi:ESCRT-II complex subunit VPS25